METRNTVTPRVYVISAEKWKESKKKELKFLWILNKINSDKYFQTKMKNIIFSYLKMSKGDYPCCYRGISLLPPGILVGCLNYCLLKSNII